MCVGVRAQGSAMPRQLQLRASIRFGLENLCRPICTVCTGVPNGRAGLPCTASKSWKAHLGRRACLLRGLRRAPAPRGCSFSCRTPYGSFSCRTPYGSFSCRTPYGSCCRAAGGTAGEGAVATAEPTREVAPAPLPASPSAAATAAEGTTMEDFTAVRQASAYGLLLLVLHPGTVHAAGGVGAGGAGAPWCSALLCAVLGTAAAPARG